MALSGSQITRIGVLGPPGRSYGVFMPKRPTLPSDTPLSRTIFVGAEDRDILVPNEDRTIYVGRG